MNLLTRLYFIADSILICRITHELTAAMEKWKEALGHRNNIG